MCRVVCEVQKKGRAKPMAVWNRIIKEAMEYKVGVWMHTTHKANEQVDVIKAQLHWVAIVDWKAHVSNKEFQVRKNIFQTKSHCDSLTLQIKLLCESWIFAFCFATSISRGLKTHKTHNLLHFNLLRIALSSNCFLSATPSAARPSKARSS